MKRLALFSVAALAAVFASAETVAYLATALNTPQTGWLGKVESVSFASTNATGTATLNAVTDVTVDGRLVSFTNELATATLVDGRATVAPTNAYVAAGQRVFVGGTAFPGGAATVWIRK